MHVNHNQEHEIINAQVEVNNKVFVVDIMEQYYGITDDNTARSIWVDHIPTGIIMPKTGPLYEKSHCVLRKNDPMGTIYFMKQFEADFRSLSNTTTYTSIELRFEVPIGTLLDQSTGDGYYGYGATTSESNDFKQIVSAGKRGRCGIPFCPSVYTNAETSPTQGDYSVITKEHYMLQSTLYRGDDSRTIIPVHINCGCTAETPPRFSCRFPAIHLLGVHNYYRLDISFDYLLKPNIRGPNNP